MTEKDIVNVLLSLVNSHGVDIDKVYSYLSEGQRKLLSSLEVSLDEAKNVERMMVRQRSCKEWFRYREKRLSSSNIHRIFIRKRQFDNLAKQLAGTLSKKLSDFARRKLKHGVQYEGTAREKCHDILNYCLSTRTILAIPHFDWFSRRSLSANITFPQCYATLSRQVTVKLMSNLAKLVPKFPFD